MKKYSFEAVIFDLDGVITKTARVHAQAWKNTFDEYLRQREKKHKETFKEFTHDDDYLPYVDGLPRYEGVKSFLESRGINLPFGDPSDSPEKETVCGLGNKKNAIFCQVLKDEGPKVYHPAVNFIKSLKEAGIKVGVASSSKNCKLILQSAGIDDLFETRVDGVVSEETGLAGKPEADIFVTAAKNLGATADKSVVIEDAVSGVKAGRNGAFGLVIGIARKNNEKELLQNGADIAFRDLSEINADFIEEWFHRKPRPLDDSWDKENLPKKDYPFINPAHIRPAADSFAKNRKLILFLDYDGTLTPIVSRPELAVLSPDMREALMGISKNHTISVISGRMREDVEKLVDIKGLFYAGSHGFDIKGQGFSMVHPEARKAIPLISEIIKTLKKELQGIDGLLIEEKKFSTAVHYRLVDEKKYLTRINEAVSQATWGNKMPKVMHGKKVFEILPNIVWDKGKAIRWIMKALKLSWKEASVVYIGDDTTDEDAFRFIRTKGTGILVADKEKTSCADFRVSSVKDVKALFEKITGNN